MVSELLVDSHVQTSLEERIRTYYEYTKPKIWYLLVFTSLTATFVAGTLLSNGLSPIRWIITGLAITSGCAGCNALTNYVDRDIDAVMNRTRHRPIPSGRITPASGLRFGLALVAISIVLSFTLNLLSVLWMALGVLDNVGVYSLLLKRRSALNILLGGFSGGLPVLFGWSAATPGPIGSISLLPVLMAGLVFLWIPIHIWFLAVTYRADYAKVGVPMLPVVIGSVPAIRLIVIFSMIFFPFSIGVYLLGHFGLVYGLVALAGGLVILIGSVWVLYKPTETNAWKMFKITSPYLFLLFLAMIIDVAVRA
ncbi:protoheme IX farnesyltransferase [Candidatus Bathyarchaeota archaeon]|nr:MAG: protoheme IX farnesyltransferase [Candidatus Bathyarchaeota archaeon]